MPKVRVCKKSGSWGRGESLETNLFQDVMNHDL
jgi:hypothetical protein